MFFKIEAGGVSESSLDKMTKNDTIAGYIMLDELEDVAVPLGLSDIAVRECLTDENPTRAALDVYEDFSFGIMNIINLADIKQKRDRVAIFLKRNMFIMVEIIDKDGSSRDMFELAMQRYKTNITLEKVIYGVMDRMLAGSSERLAEISAKVLELERSMVNNHLDDSTNKTLFNQLVGIGETLEENENDLFSEENLRYFAVFAAKAQRLSGEASEMAENLVHVREAYEAGLNYNMNKTMQFFTVIATIFMPLTLLVGWFGMNFTNMPLIQSEYGYPFIIIVSILLVAANLYWFHRKKYM
jgi:magnesium transporter